MRVSQFGISGKTFRLPAWFFVSEMEIFCVRADKIFVMQEYLSGLVSTCTNESQYYTCTTQSFTPKKKSRMIFQTKML